jgi:hypothetical protein
MAIIITTTSYSVIFSVLIIEDLQAVGSASGASTYPVVNSGVDGP